MLIVALFACATLGNSGCSAPDANGRTVGKFPDPATFKPLANMMIARCGSLDCHGQPGRNLKIYGASGLRLAGGDEPTKAGPLFATANEYEADYGSVCGLEPETLAAVVQDGGKNPERLTMVQKARNSQEHKGGAVIVRGDAQDRCMLSWLTGTIDAQSCQDALKLP